MELDNKWPVESIILGTDIGNILLPEDVSLVVCFGIEFLEKTGTGFAAIDTHSALGVVEVY